MIRVCRLVGLLLIGLVTAASGQRSPSRPPVIDVHMHAAPVALFGPPQPNCAHTQTFTPRDPRQPEVPLAVCRGAAATLSAPKTDAEAQERLRVFHHNPSRPPGANE